MPPYRAWPSGIFGAARDHVNVELVNDVADGRDVDAVRGIKFSQGVARPLDLVERKRAILDVQIGKLAQSRAPGHQNKPWKARVIEQQNAAERHVRQKMRVGGKPWMQRESSHFDE